MDNDTTAPGSLPNAETTLLAQTAQHTTAVMIGALPTPRPDTPETRKARNVNAISQVASLVPVNPAETMMAVQIVTAGAQGLACQRQAQDQDEVQARRSILLAAMMMRVSHGAAHVLLRLQAARQVREATHDSANSALLTEHCMRQIMLDSAAKLEAAEAEDRAAAQEAAERKAAAEARQQPPPEPPLEPITEADIAAAEAYAKTNASNLNRARIMRRKHGMPDWGMFTPPEDNVIRAIAFGHSSFLDSLLPD